MSNLLIHNVVVMICATALVIFGGSPWYLLFLLCGSTGSEYYEERSSDLNGELDE